MENLKSLGRVLCLSFLLSICIVFIKPVEPVFEAPEQEFTESPILQKEGVKLLGLLISHLHAQTATEGESNL